MALKNTINLNKVTQEELNCVKHIASGHLVMSEKFNFYANQIQDPQFKQMLTQSSTDAKTTATNFINSL